MSWTEELPELPGIYKLTNLINGKIYVGESKNIFGRIKKYPNEGNRRTIMYAIQKYGWNNFRKEAIEVFPPHTSKRVLKTRETFWIKTLQSHVMKHGYNEIEDTIDIRGTEIQRKRKIRFKSGLVNLFKAPKKGVCKPVEYDPLSEEMFKSTPVFQLVLGTQEVLKRWPSTRAASVALSGGISGATAIGGVARGKYGRKSYYGFGWKLVYPESNGFNPDIEKKLNDETRKKISKSKKGKLKGEESSQFGRKISSRKGGPVRVTQIDPSTNLALKTWESISAASRAVDIHPSAIYACINKKRGCKMAGGFRWELAESVKTDNT